MSSGGAPSQTTSTVNQSNLPEYAKPYFESLLGRTETASQAKYTPYSGSVQLASGQKSAPGQTLAGQSPDTLSAQQAVRGVVGQYQGDVNAARYGLGGVYDIAQNLGAYQAPDIASSYQAPSSYTPGQFQTQPITPGTVTSQDFTGANLSNYMSPYMQSVVEAQKAAATRAFQEGQAARDTGAIRSGAFGGYRNAIERGVAQRGLEQNLTNIEAQGAQSAYQQAMAQYNADQARALQAASTTAGLGLTAQQANQAALMQAQQMGEASRQYGSTLGSQQGMFGAQQDLQAQIAAAQAAQQAAGVQAQGGALALQGAQGYGNIGSLQQQLGLGGAQALGASGAQQQAYEQQQLDIARQQFENQRDYEKQMLQFYSGILHGVPVSPSSNITQYQSTSPVAQMAGLGLSGLALSKMMG